MFVDFNLADTIIEIGPGMGVITDELIQHNKEVVAVEADQKLFSKLQKRYATVKNLTLVNTDFLKYLLPEKPFVAVSNVPFNITANLIRKITDEKSKLSVAYLIVQKEAAIKFVGAPYAHSPLLSHLLQINFEIRCLMDILRTNYSPRPRFDTTFLMIKRRENPIFDEPEAVQFKNFLVYIFERRKPQIKDALKSLMSNLQVKIILSNLNIPAGTEIKKIMFADWVKIFNTFVHHAPEKSKKIISGSYAKLLAEQLQLKKINRSRADT